MASPDRELLQQTQGVQARRPLRRQNRRKHYKAQLKLKDWAFAIAQQSTMRQARVALARRLAITMHAMLRDGTEFASA